MGRDGTAMPPWRTTLAHAVAGGVPRRCFYVAVVVGTILNLINQGDALFGAAPVSWLKLILTYVVPYAVCTYGAVSAKIHRVPRSPH
jgi:hypothetical protein